MRIFIIAGILLLAGCNSKNSREKAESTENTADTTQQKPIQETSNTKELESSLDLSLKSKHGPQWRLVSKNDVGYDMNAYKKYLDNGRSNELNNPYLVEADFNCDGIMDYAAVVTDDKKFTDKLNLKLAIFASGHLPMIWDKEKQETAAGSFLYVSSQKDFTGASEEEQPVSVKMQCKGVELIVPDVDGAIVYWDGKSFKKAYVE